MSFKTGIDLGGTKTEIVVLDPGNQPIYRKRVATPAGRYSDIIHLLDQLVRGAESELQVATVVGIGVPGAISPQTGLMRNANTVSLNGKPLLQDLERQLERRIRIENDANCFVLSEALNGAAANFETVFGVIIGTGTGGGLVVNRKLLNGPHSIAGEWGHNPLPWLTAEDGNTQCYCGKQGCIETYLSGPGMAASYQALTGRLMDSDAIVAASQQQDRDALVVLNRYFDQLSRALAHVINILDPHAIVLGGGMSNIEAIYEAVPRRLPQYVFSDFVNVPVLRAELGDASGVFGAAMLCSD